MAQAILGSSSLSHLPSNSSSELTSTIFGSRLKFVGIEHTQLRLRVSFKSKPALRLQASRESPRLTQDETNNKLKTSAETQNESNPFTEMKHRFLSFKKNKFLKNSENFQNLAKGQAPKFMVIACADSRVCPSHILGFQPGEAFVVRNVANMVPASENGPSETNAALDFAVNSLQVQNILVVGHSFCGGIRALMSMKDDANLLIKNKDEANSSSFIESWVVVGKNARVSTKASAADLSFEQQCRHCEKESVNQSLFNLLTYPWIRERVARGMLSVHGGYYNFVDCTFEKWTLDYPESSSRAESGECSLKNREFWC